MAADRRPPPCWLTSINLGVIQHVWRNNLRIDEINISPILTCLSLSDWQRKTLIMVIIQQWYSLESIFCDVDSATQLAGATKSSTSSFVFRSEFANPWHPKFNKVNFYIKWMSGNKNMYFIFSKKKSEVWEKIVLEQVRSKFLRTFFKPPFWKSAFLRSPRRTLHNQIKYFSCSDCNEPNIFLKLGNSFIEICCFGNKLYSRFYGRDLIGNRYMQTANELLNRIGRKQSLTKCVDHHLWSLRKRL